MNSGKYEPGAFGQFDKESNMNRSIYVSKDPGVQADFYIESEAEEIYMPDSSFRPQGGRNRKVSTTTEDDSGIIGYQKYLHIVNRLALDNTDANEPLQPELSQFLRVTAQEEEQEFTQKLQEYSVIKEGRREEHREKLRLRKN